MKEQRLLRKAVCELDICRIHLEEYHEPGFLHFQQVYSVYCNLLSTHLKHWRLRGRESKQPGYIFCSIVIVSLSNTAWPLIYLKISSWELTQGHPEQRSEYCLEISITWGRLKISRWPVHLSSFMYNRRSLFSKFPTIF